MSISVRFFASVRERVGRSEANVEVQGAIPVTVLWDKVTGMTRPPKLLVAINQEYVDWEAVASDGDEVGFFPPVTGG
ncbi:MAG: MoaD/ThiS family protein [Gammaproteobacteria bacterium]|nr:MoaD/ThiS family protein [Gammaproteobacteria bacterium]